MSKWCTYIIFIAVISAIPGCRQAVATNPLQATISYDDSVYCFNLRSIVSREGLKGIADLDGNVVLPLEWDSIEFLDDDVALLSRSGLWYLSTKDGRIFAQATDPSELEASSTELFTRMQEDDLRHWDSVLDQLEALSHACISSARKGMNECILSEQNKLQQLLRERPGTAMSKAQEKRLEAIESEFSSLYRR